MTASRNQSIYLSRTALVALPLLLVLLIPVIVYRWLLQLVAPRLRPDLSHMLRGHGPIFLRRSVHAEPNLNVLVSLHMDRHCDYEKSKRLFAERFVYVRGKNEDGSRGALVHPELQQACVPWAGYFFWKQEADFRLEEHIRLAKPAPGEDIQAFALGYLKEPLPEGRSPWELLVVPADGDGDAPPKTTHRLLLKYHHVLGDGFSILEAASKFVDPDAPFVHLDRTKHEHRTNRIAGITALRRLVFPAHAALDFLRLVTARTPMLPWSRIPAEPFAGGRRQHHIAVDMACDGQEQRQSVDMVTVKRIAARHRVCTTAVLYGAITGTLRVHLLSKYEPVEVPAHVGYLQTVPIVPHPFGLVNAVAGVTFRLPIGDPDPASRLRTIHRMVQERKQSAESLVEFCMMQIRSLFPYNFPLIYTLDANSMCIGTTNLPGPLKPCAIGGQRVRGIDFQMAAGPYAFYASMMSYDGVLRWSCNGDTRVFTAEELRLVAEGIRQEFEALDKIPPFTPAAV